MENQKCKRCGRALKNSTAIERGYGCGCYKKLGLEPTKKDRYGQRKSNSYKNASTI